MGGQLTVPVIMMSGHATLETAGEATRLGALDFLEKPIALARLLGAVRSGLDQGQRLRGSRTVPMAGPGAEENSLLRTRPVPGEPEGTVHVSKAKEGYTESLSSEFAVGDIILAKVLQSHPSVKLTTAPSSLGVVSARCQVCHHLLARRTKGLECPRCGHHEQRKLAHGPAFPAPAPESANAR